MALAPDQITSLYRERLGDSVIDTSTLHDQASVVVELGAWRDAFSLAHDDETLDCDFLTFVSAIDWVELETEGEKPEREAPQDEPGEQGRDAESAFRMPLMPTYQVVGRVYSTTKRHGVTIKADCPYDSPAVGSLIDVYAGADWHEREMMEMFGIDVTDHPNKEKLYLPDDFEGHPLRKTYQLGSREVKPWPGAVDVEDMPDDTPVTDADGNVLAEFSTPEADGSDEGSTDAEASTGGDES